MDLKTIRWDSADYFTSAEDIAAYLEAALAERAAAFQKARDIAERARSKLVFPRSEQ